VRKDKEAVISNEEPLKKIGNKWKSEGMKV